jgi:hypothetical protein
MAKTCGKMRRISRVRRRGLPSTPVAIMTTGRFTGQHTKGIHRRYAKVRRRRNFDLANTQASGGVQYAMVSACFDSSNTFDPGTTKFRANGAPDTARAACCCHPSGTASPWPRLHKVPVQRGCGAPRRSVRRSRHAVRAQGIEGARSGRAINKKHARHVFY